MLEEYRQASSWLGAGSIVCLVFFNGAEGFWSQMKLEASTMGKLDETKAVRLSFPELLVMSN